MRHARRTDRNHAEIRDGLRAAGYDCLDLSDVGGGVPDLCCNRLDLVLPPIFLEIKDTTGIRNPKPKPHTKEQELWLRYCGAITFTVTSLEEALEVLKREDNQRPAA